jgi:penicillin-binding protein 2
VSDAQGVAQGSLTGRAWDRVSWPGKDLKTIIDTALQTYGEQLIEHKVGSIVAIVAQTGALLALIFSPSYNPNLLTEKNASTPLLL